MKTRYEIEVSQADIDDGIRGNSFNCMVTVAINRLIPEANRAEALSQTIRFSLVENGKRYRLVYLTPRTPREYLVQFDAGDTITPFAFVLEKPTGITEMPQRQPQTAKNVSFKAQAKGMGERRSKRVFGEKAFRVNQVAS